MYSNLAARTFLGVTRFTERSSGSGGLGVRIEQFQRAGRPIVTVCQRGTRVSAVAPAAAGDTARTRGGSRQGYGPEHCRSLDKSADRAGGKLCV